MSDPSDDCIVKLMNLNGVQHRIIMECIADGCRTPSALRYFEIEMRGRYGDNWREELDK